MHPQGVLAKGSVNSAGILRRPNGAYGKMGEEIIEILLEIHFPDCEVRSNGTYRCIGQTFVDMLMRRRKWQWRIHVLRTMLCNGTHYLKMISNRIALELLSVEQLMKNGDFIDSRWSIWSTLLENGNEEAQTHLTSVIVTFQDLYLSYANTSIWRKLWIFIRIRREEEVKVLENTYLTALKWYNRGRVLYHVPVQDIVLMRQVEI